VAAGDAAVAEATCDGSCCWLPDAKAGWWVLVTLVEAGERRGAAEGAASSAEGRRTAEAAMAAVAVAGDEAGDEEEAAAETGAEAAVALWAEQR
jgi:hypothetical protein